MGGLGFRDMHYLNLALLAKQLWRFLEFPSTLLARVLKGIYFRNCSPLEDKKAYSPSYVWISIWKLKKRSNKEGYDTKVLVRTGSQIFWRDPRGGLLNIVGRDPNLMVHHLTKQDNNQWDIDQLISLFQPDKISLMLGLRQSNSYTKDSFAWSYTKSRAYTVKPGYEMVRKENIFRGNVTVLEPSIILFQSQVWKIKTPGKFRHFMWQTPSRCVATC